MRKLLTSVLLLTIQIGSVLATEQVIDREKLNHFGSVSESYQKGRKGYSGEIYNFIKKHVPSNSKIIDLGCGTGISTRELYQAGYSNITGCDLSEEQLHFALQNNNSERMIPYFQGNISKGLTDKEGNSIIDEYDAATAFAAFHWFADPQSVQNIYSILKKGAYFVVVSGEPSFLNDYSKFMEKYIGQIDHPKKSLRVLEVLERAGFSLVKIETFQSQKTYTFEEAVALLQSNSRWAALVKSGKNTPEVVGDLEEFVRNHLTNDKLVVQTTPTVTIVKK